MLLDENYTWVAADWINGKFDGTKNGGAVFGDSNKMYVYFSSSMKGRQNKMIVYEDEGYKMFQKGEILVLELREN